MHHSPLLMIFYPKNEKVNPTKTLLLSNKETSIRDFI